LHCNLPIWHLSHRASRREVSGKTFVEYTLIPSVAVARLREDPSFKRPVLEEVEAQGEGLLDITPLVRVYMESLGRIHETTRKLLEADLAVWDSTTQGALMRYAEGGAKSALGLSVVSLSKDGTQLECFPIFSKVTKRRRWLVRKNRRLTRYSSLIVSSHRGRPA
jgi:hypothetical protein